MVSWGVYLLPFSGLVTCKSGQTRQQGPERLFWGTVQTSVDWANTLRGWKGFLRPPCAGSPPHLHHVPCYTLQHVPTSNIPTCTTRALSSSFAWRLLKPSSCWSTLTSEGWTHLAPISGSKSQNACLGISVRKSGRWMYMYQLQCLCFQVIGTLTQTGKNHIRDLLVQITGNSKCRKDCRANVMLSFLPLYSAAYGPHFIVWLPTSFCEKGAASKSQVLFDCFLDQTQRKRERRGRFLF